VQCRLSRGWALLAALVLWSCQPEIGDSCSNASDCSQQGERTCDTTFPGGYCTKFGCSADSCPSEAACIGFQTLISIAPECANLQARPRLQRTSCMRSCDKDSDCRSGSTLAPGQRDYVCVDLALPNPWGALLIDRSGSAKVCTLAPPPDPVGETGVCRSQPAALTPPQPATGPAPVEPTTDAGSDSAPNAE